MGDNKVAGPDEFEIEGQPRLKREVRLSAISAASDLQLNFKKQLCLFGTTLAILYKISKY